MSAKPPHFQAFDPRFDPWNDLLEVGKCLGQDSHDPHKNDWSYRREHNRWMGDFSAELMSLARSGEYVKAGSASLAYALEAIKPMPPTLKSIRGCILFEIGNENPAIKVTDPLLSNLVTAAWSEHMDHKQLGTLGD